MTRGWDRNRFSMLIALIVLLPGSAALSAPPIDGPVNPLLPDVPPRQVRDATAPDGRPFVLPTAALERWRASATFNAPPHDPKPSYDQQNPTDTRPRHPLTAAAELKLAEIQPGLLAWLQQWDASAAKGETPGHSDRPVLKTLLEQTPLNSVQLYALGQGVGYASGDAWSNVFYAAAVDQAEKELAGVPRGDAKAKPILAALNRMNHPSGWRAHEVKTLVKLYALLKDHKTPNSREQRRATYLWTETLYMQGDADTAIEHLNRLAEALNRDPKSTDADRLAVAWLKALSLHYCGRLEEALPVLADVATSEASYRDSAAERQIETLTSLGRIEEARRALDAYAKRKPDSTKLAALRENLRSREAYRKFQADRGEERPR